MTEHSIPDIVGTIKEKRLAPIPRWAILAKRIAFWGLLGAFIIIGTVFLSLGLVDILDVGPDIFRALGFRRFPLLLFLGTPLLWTLLAGLSLAFGILAFRNTRYGYRVRALFVGSLITLSIVTLTAIAHKTRLDDRLDQTLEYGAPKRALRFSHPEDGVIAGKILEANNPNISFVIRTPQNELWTVFLSDTTQKTRRVRIESGFDVIIIGKPKAPTFFDAFFIRPLRNNANSPRLFPYHKIRGAHDL